MFREDIQHKSKRVFKRLTGVNRATFNNVVQVVKEHILARQKHPAKSSPVKRSIEDQILMLLMYSKMASGRVVIEPAIRRLKVYRTLSERYHNRRKGFSFRVHLISGFLNYELNS